MKGLLAIATALMLVAAGPAEAQASAPRPAVSRPAQPEVVDPALRPTVDRVRIALAAMVRADREILPAEGSSTLRGADEATLQRRSEARAQAIAGLDTLLASGARGRVAIRVLVVDWSSVDLVRRYEVRAAFVAHDAVEALRLTDRLAAAAARDTQLIGWRAIALDSLGRAPDALRARQARYELAPDDPTAWRTLLRAHEAAGSLPQLRASLGRLRLLYPSSRAVREHEIEVLHRLGRGEEAARIAADTLGVAR